MIEEGIRGEEEYKGEKEVKGETKRDQKWPICKKEV